MCWSVFLLSLCVGSILAVQIFYVLMIFSLHPVWPTWMHNEWWASWCLVESWVIGPGYAVCSGVIFCLGRGGGTWVFGVSSAISHWSMVFREANWQAMNACFIWTYWCEGYLDMWFLPLMRDHSNSINVTKNKEKILAAYDSFRQWTTQLPDMKQALLKGLWARVNWVAIISPIFVAQS